MKKKGLIAMGLAGILTVGMCMPVLAAESGVDSITQDSPAGTTKDAEVSYTVSPTYSITIPATVTLGESPEKIDFKGTTGNINGKQRLDIKMTGFTNSRFELRDGEGTVEAVVKLGEALVTADSVVASYVQDTMVGQLKNNKEILTIAKPVDDAWAGTYKGTATFEVDLVTEQ